MSILLFDVYMGFRSKFVIAAGAIMLIWARDCGIVRMIPNKIGYVLTVVLFTFLIMTYKGIYTNVKAGQWDLISARLTSTEYYVNSILLSEPNGVQSILNRTVVTNYHTGAGQLWDLVLLPVLGALDVLGSESFGLSEGFDPQTALFPGVRYGVASNVWAQMWSIGGVSGVIIFVCVFVCIIIVMNYWILRARISVAGILALCGIVWVFYIHRNNIRYEGDLLKRYVLVFMGCWAWTILLVGNRAPRRPDCFNTVPPARSRAGGAKWVWHLPCRQWGSQVVAQGRCIRANQQPKPGEGE
jgi:hypothetical protein